MFAELAELEHVCARAGFDPNPREIWEIAAALGVGTESKPSELAPGVNIDKDTMEMIRAAEEEARTGKRARWSRA